MWPSWATIHWYKGMTVSLDEDIEDEISKIPAGTEMVIKEFWGGSMAGLILCEVLDEKGERIRRVTVPRNKLTRVH